MGVYDQHMTENISKIEEVGCKRSRIWASMFACAVENGTQGPRRWAVSVWAPARLSGFTL